MTDRPFSNATITITEDQPAGRGPLRSYLLVIDGHSSTIFPLPWNGEILIGRAEEAQIPLRDGAASRQHARLLSAAGCVTISDLGSHNGTWVNGKRLTTPRALVSRDVIALGDLTLVMHRDAGLPQRRAVHETAALRERLEQEVARALHCQCPLGILCLDPGAPAPDLQRLTAMLSAKGLLRRMDFVARHQDQLVILLPEQEGEEANATAVRLVQALLPLAPQVRGGWASLPEDGGDTDTLLCGARAAAQSAPVGQLARAAEVTSELLVGPHRVVLADPAMVRSYDLIARLARSDLSVLLCGETGTGKELAALALHQGSTRSAERMVAINCAALPEALVEGELFGYERGAFSGAVASKPGLLESAHRGTVFLDEIGELPMATQAKLLRVLETRQVLRLGDLRERAIDVRIVAATNRSLDDEVNAGRFRQDLLFRLGAATVTLPPLRDRTRELLVLARRFLAVACTRADRPPSTLSPLAIQTLLTYRWPGNVRELKNVMEYLATAVPEPVIGPWHLPERVRGAPPDSPSAPMLVASARFQPLEDEVRELERTRMAEALQAAGGVQTRAAELLRMPLRTFSGKVKLYGLLSLANTRRK